MLTLANNAMPAENEHNYDAREPLHVILLPCKQAIRVLRCAA